MLASQTFSYVLSYLRSKATDPSNEIPHIQCRELPRNERKYIFFFPPLPPPSRVIEPILGNGRIPVPRPSVSNIRIVRDG